MCSASSMASTASSMSMLPLILRRPGVDEFLGRLGDHRVAVVVEPVDQRADRRVFLILDDRRVVVGAEQRSPALEFLEEALVVDVEAQCLCGCVKIGAVDEERDLFTSSSNMRFPGVLLSCGAMPAMNKSFRRRRKGDPNLRALGPVAGCNHRRPGLSSGRCGAASRQYERTYSHRPAPVQTPRGKDLDGPRQRPSKTASTRSRTASSSFCWRAIAPA
jgi:hypothetical protein